MAKLIKQIYSGQLKQLLAFSMTFLLASCESSISVQTASGGAIQATNNTTVVGGDNSNTDVENINKDDSAASTDSSQGAGAGAGTATGSDSASTPAASVMELTTTDANATYTQGSTITIKIKFSDTITVTGAPRLALNSNNTTVYANYVSTSGDTITFQYVVGAGDSSASLDAASTSALDLNGGTIRDSHNKDVVTTLPVPGAASSLSASAVLVIGDPPGAFIIAWASAGSSQVTLDWSASSYATSYTIKRGTSSGSYSTTVSTSAVAPFVDSGLTNGTTYYYMIIAVNNRASVNATAEVSAAPVLFTANAGPDKTAGATVTLVGNLPAGAVTQQWTQVSGPGTVTFGTANAKNTTASANTVGTYVLRYTLTDSSGGTAQDDMTFVWDQTTPSFTSLDLFGVSLNAEVDRVESRSGELIADNLVGTNYASAGYLLTDVSSTCSSFGAGAYRSEIPTAREFSDFINGNQYKVCTRLEQSNGFASFGASAAIVRESTLPVSDPKTVKQVSGKFFHVCAILNDDTLRCWGRNDSGQLGYDDTTNRGGSAGSMAGLAAVNLGAHTAKAVAAGGAHTCAILDDDTVKCWGNNGYGQLGYNNMTARGNTAGSMAALGIVNLGAGRTAKALTAGLRHSCAILDNDTMKCWGNGASGQLGNDSGADVGTSGGSMAALGAINLGAGRTAKAMAAGVFHTCAILDDDTLKCWGSNYYGQLGYGDNADRGFSTGDMAALATVNLGAGRTAKAIGSGYSHVCAVLDNDTLKCWGDNNYYALGTSGSFAAPDATALNLGTGRTAKSVVGGAAHTCAILDNNTAKCWGLNSGGQLGQDNKQMYGPAFATVASLSGINLGAGRTAVAVATGEYFSCAILDDLTLKCWGSNTYGALGSDNLSWYGGTNKSTANAPLINFGVGRTVKRVVPGSLHICAILDDDTVSCWGDNSEGQLGYDNTTPLTTPGGPVDFGAGRTVKSLTIGERHSCVLLDDNTVKCWGANDYGQLGQDHTNKIGHAAGSMASLAPVNLGTGRTAKAVAAGRFYTCAILDNDAVKCWGYNSDGQLGYDDTTNRGDTAGAMAILNTVNLGSARTAKAISSGLTHTCAILDNDTVKCWGQNGYGQLGYDDTNARGNSANSMATTKTVNLGHGRRAKAISVGSDHTCAILDDDNLKCWGLGIDGALGYDGISNRGNSAGSMGSLTTINLGAGRTAKSVIAGYRYTCVILDNAAVKCWGTAGAAIGYDDGNRRGAGDLGNMMASLSTVKIAIGHTTKFLSVGMLGGQTCAVLNDDTAKCWGWYTDDKNYGGGYSMTELQPIYFP